MGTHRVDVATLHPVVRIIQRWRDIVHVGGNNQKHHRLVPPSRRPSHGPLDPDIFEQGLQSFEPSICQSLLRLVWPHTASRRNFYKQSRLYLQAHTAWLYPISCSRLCACLHLGLHRFARSLELGPLEAQEFL